MNVVHEEHSAAVILNDGERVVDTLKALCTANGIKSATVLSGIGMLRETEIGYWNGREYETAKIKEPVELLSMQGSIAVMPDGISPHLHVSFAIKDHSCKGGHLINATVHIINEISMNLYRAAFVREFSRETGLNMLRFQSTGK